MSTHPSPQPFDDSRDRLRRALSEATQLLVCLDFDGTLAPIVDDPDDAMPTPANAAAVRTLASTPHVTTAVVSGRALTDVRDRIDGPSIYAGNHGLELEREGSVAVHPVAKKRTTRLAAVCALLDETVGTIPGCHIENKRLTGTVHFRSVPEPAWPLVRQQTHEAVDRFGGGDLTVSSGKQIVEIGPAVPWEKGNAVELIAADLPETTCAIYIGDDVTDESAFRALEPTGIGIHVGDDESSAASIRVDSPDDVTTVLDWLGSTGVDLIHTD